ncbi:hypothetical protein G6F66_014692 [Rhizopus arrhizus]|nr:hypothetical protein G6F66_014692 [Rhizopus arrhizus]
MSHEIRTPMSTLLGMLERLADSDLDARQQQVLATVGDAARMLRQILDDVLHSQRLQPAPLQLRPTDLAAMLRAVQQLLMPVAASRGLHLRIELDPARHRCHRRSRRSAAACPAPATHRGSHGAAALPRR